MSAWTDERVALLCEEWPSGKPAPRIADLLNALPGPPVTANAVVSKRIRLKLPAHSAAAHQTNAAAARAARNFLIGGNGAVIEKPDAGPPRITVRPDAFAPLPGTTPVPWTQRGFGQCCWPVDLIGADEQHSCAAKCGEGQRYCDAHLTMRAQPQDSGKAERSVQELIRGLRRYV